MGKIKTEVIEKLAALITASFGLIAALAWNEYVSSLFAEGGSLHLLARGPLVYAILVTLLAIFATIWIGRISERAKGKKR